MHDYRRVIGEAGGKAEVGGGGGAAKEQHEAETGDMSMRHPRLVSGWRWDGNRVGSGAGRQAGSLDVRRSMRDQSMRYQLDREGAARAILVECKNRVAGRPALREEDKGEGRSVVVEDRIEQKDGSNSDERIMHKPRAQYQQGQAR